MASNCKSRKKGKHSSKKSRNPDALNAIIHRKGGVHKDKRNKINDELWKSDLIK